MPRRFPLTLLTTAALTGAYLLYALVVGSVVRPPGIASIPSSAPSSPAEPPARNRQAALEYLDRPEMEWIPNATYQQSSERTIVYAQETLDRTREDGTISFRPFAMIYFQGEDKEPIRVVAESARVRFENAFDISNPEPGKIATIELNGEVTVFGEGGLELTGTGFVFDGAAKHIRSDEFVKFRYGLHKGTADGLEVQLIEAEDPEASNDLGVTGIREIRLQRHVVMHLTEEAKNTKGKPAPAKPAKPDTAQAPNMPKFVTVTCDDGFTYECERNVGTFNENVFLKREIPGAADVQSLACDKLELHFESEALPNDTIESIRLKGEVAHSDDKPQPSDAMAVSMLDENLTFRRLVATGERYQRTNLGRRKTPLRNVRLIDDSNNLQADMTELSYDSREKTVVLRDDEVLVLHGQSELRCPEITLVHDDDDNLTSAECRGTGSLKHVDEFGVEVFSASWLEQMLKYPDPDHATLDVIEMQNQAIVRKPDEQSELKAELIKLWVDREKDLKAGSKASKRKSKAGAFDPQSSDVRPRRLLALKNVDVSSPQLNAQTDRLEVWFEQRKTPRPTAAGQRPEPASKTVKTDPRRATESSPIIHPAGHSNSPSSATGSHAVHPAAEDPVSAQQAARTPSPTRERPGRRESALDEKLSDEPLVVDADLIQLLVRHDRGFEDPDVAEVRAEESVKVSQKQKPGVEPFHMTGDKMHITRHGALDDVMHVSGKPAHIRGDGHSISGDEIHLNRKSNLTWINGAGVLRIPIDSDLEGNLLEIPELLNVYWTEQMHFDGRIASFFGNVRAIVNENVMRCQEMHVGLTRRILFSEEQQDKKREKIGIQKISCRNGVQFESYERDDVGQLIGVRFGSAADLHRDHTTGRTTAAGPGHVRSWKRGPANRAGLAAANAVQPNAPLETNAGEWEYTQIDFVGNGAGVIRRDETAPQHHMTFHDQVEIVYGPVERSNQTIDPDDLPEGGGWMRSNVLTVTHHAKTSERDEYNDILATGNTELEGRMFHARADEINYDESKLKYILRSADDRDATIWRQEHAGGDYSRVDAKRMEFIPDSNKLRVYETSSIQGGQ